MEENTNNTDSKPIPTMESNTTIDDTTSTPRLAAGTNSSEQASPPRLSSNQARVDPHLPEGFGRALDQAIFTKPNPNDPVFAAASEAIRNYNISSFEHFRNPIKILPLAHETLKYALAESEPRYYVLRWGGFDQIVAFRIRKSDASNKVQIHTSGEWAELETWLQQLTRPTPPASSDSQLYEIQSRWWLENGKHFPLLSLPNELMDQVLLECLGEEVAVIRLFDDRVSSYAGFFCNGARHELNGRPWGESLDFTVPKPISPVNKNIMQLSRELHQRARRIFEKDTVKVFSDAYILHEEEFDEDISSGRHFYGMDVTKPITCIPPRIDLASMRRISLKLSMKDYIEFFGIPVPPLNLFVHRDWTKEPDAKILKALPNLRELTMWFQSTVNQESSAWHSFAHCLPGELDELQSILPPAQFDGVCELYWEMDWERFPCQKEVIEIILLHAYRFVKDIPQVEFTGYTKDETRTKWQRLLREPQRKGQYDLEIVKRLEEFKEIPMSEL